MKWTTLSLEIDVQAHETNRGKKKTKHCFTEFCLSVDERDQRDWECEIKWHLNKVHRSSGSCVIVSLWSSANSERNGGPPDWLPSITWTNHVARSGYRSRSNAIQWSFLIGIHRPFHSFRFWIFEVLLTIRWEKSISIWKKMETNNPAMKYLEKKRTTKEIKANNSTLSFDPGTWEIPSNVTPILNQNVAFRSKSKDLLQECDSIARVPANPLFLLRWKHN